jgi:hypothetical protein
VSEPMGSDPFLGLPGLDRAEALAVAAERSGRSASAIRRCLAGRTRGWGMAYSRPREAAERIPEVLPKVLSNPNGGYADLSQMLAPEECEELLRRRDRLAGGGGR